MKLQKLFVLFTFLFLFSAVSENFAQISSSYDKRRSQMFSFNQKYGNNLKINWNGLTGTPISISGLNIRDYKGTPLNISKSFLKDEKEMFGISNFNNDLHLIKTNYS